MKVTLRLHTILQSNFTAGKQKQIEFETNEHATIGDILRAIPLDLTPENVLIVINHHVYGFDHHPSDQDIIDLIPALSGG